jgi:cbb3-type cytochrome oxidase maturation protein
VSVIILLIGFSLLVAVIFLFSFLWAVKNGQYEDRYTPSVRILFENEITNVSHGENEKKLNQKEKEKVK